MSESDDPGDGRTPVGTSRTKLSLAVWLFDGFTGERPGGMPVVSLADRNESFVTNPSGYRVLTDLPESVETVSLEVDAGPRYLPERRRVDLDGLDPASPVVPIELHPAPAYRFPAGETLVRGVVRDADGERLADAALVVDGWSVETRSDDRGEFVLFFDGLTADDVTEGEDGRVVTIDGDDPTIVATHDEAGTTSRSVTVTEGTTTAVDVEY